MRSNRLQLNTAKTEVLWCASSRRQHQLPQITLRVGTNYVTPTTSVRDVGIYVDSDVSMRTHMSRTVSSCFVVLRQLCSIRQSTSQAVLLSLVVSLVLSHLDYATRRSPVYLATSSTDYSLWWTPLHNLFALSLRGSTSTSPATPLPSLAASARADIIEFKLSVLVFRCLHGTALSMVWRASYVVWRTWIQESGCDLNRRLPLSHHLRVVRRLVTMRSSSLHRVPGTLCHPASLCLRQSAPSSVVWKCIFLPRHSLNFSKLRTSDFVLYFDSEKCSWSNL